MTVLEAFVGRTPVVTANVSSLPGIGADIARYGFPQQPETYATAIRATLDPPAAEDTNARVAAGALTARPSSLGLITGDARRMAPATPATPVSEPRSAVTLAHDYLLVTRGAERTFAAIADLYPAAPIYTLLYDDAGTDGRFAGRSVTTSPLQHLGVRQGGFRRLLPVYPTAIRTLRPGPCDVLLSSSSAFAHGIVAPPGAVHICYCYTPFRYAWSEQQRALSEMPRWLRPLLSRQLRRIREWDLEASRRVDAYIAISQLSRERIKRFYGRESTVIHPPVETDRFQVGTPGDALLIVSELVSHKRVDVALEAARRARAAIQVVGSGPDSRALEEAYPEAEFFGRLPDEELAELYAQARAVIVPSVEEFGITAVEAQASGRPVLAAAAGGALETVLDGRTGRLVPPDDIGALADAIRELDDLDFDPAESRENAERFSLASFRMRLEAEIARVAPEGR